MSDAHSGFGDFGKWVPGFEFLQNLTKPGQSPSAASGLGHWVAPTLNVEELDKRIQELKAVQFWLEQNGTALKATIQALEVQKMTVSALKGMNVSMQDMAQAFNAKVPAPPAAPPAAPASAQSGQEEPPPATKTRAKSAKARAKEAAAAAGVVDPMQWWGALTQQFQHIASTALADAQSRSAQAPAPAPAPAPAAAGTGKKPAAGRPARHRKPAAPR
ncbi:MAG: PhaM family polyhydroxyalkanoate granule multifunctional regulatory protein [Betaproteobacteria bacterium]